MPKYTEGVCEDGAAILRQGVPMPISEVLRKLNEADDFHTLAKTRLDALLAAELGAGEDYSRDYTEVLLNIGRGLFWAKEFDQQARELAKKVELNLSSWALPEDSQASYEVGISPKT